MNLCPSTTWQEPWIFLAAPGQVFESTPCSGKWCIFRSPEAIDAAWIQVSELISTGSLVAAKVSTRRSVVAGAYDRHVICVYTRDWEDRTDVQQTREVLRRAGFKERLGYKRDIDTIAGIERFIFES